MKRADWSRARWIWGLLFVFATPLCAAPTSGEPSDAAPLVDSDTTLVSELSPTRADSLQALSDLTLRVEPRPLSSTQLQEARKAAQLAARNLDAFLARGSESNRQAWRSFLRWDDLQRELQDESAKSDAATLADVLTQLYSGEPGLELPAFLDLRESLMAYRRLGLALAEDDFPARLQEQLAAIREDLTRGERLSPNEFADLAARLEWLEQLGQGPALIAAIRNHYDHPNLYVSASAATISAGFSEPVSERTAVNEMILRTHVTGTAQTVGTVATNLVPNPETAVIELVLTGTSYSNTIGRQAPVTISSRGVTQLLARKRLLIDELGIRAEPATACCSTDTQICSIRPDGKFAAGLVTKIAWKQARQQQPQVEQISSRRVERQIARRLDEQTLNRIATSNTNLERKLRVPLKRRNIYPRRLQFATVRDRLRFTALQGRTVQLAAPSTLPPEPAQQLAVQVHESMLLNTAVNAIGGMTITDERAQELVKEVTGDVPEELKIKQDEDPWSITFDLMQPLRVEFEDDEVKIAIRGRKFVRGDQVVRQTTQIAASYRIQIQAGRARLVRQGEIEVTYPDKGEGERLSLTELRNKTFLINKFEGLFKPQLDGEGINLSDRWAKLKDLSLEFARAEAGWLSLGWSDSAASGS